MGSCQGADAGTRVVGRFQVRAFLRPLGSTCFHRTPSIVQLPRKAAAAPRFGQHPRDSQHTTQVVAIAGNNLGHRPAICQHQCQGAARAVTMVVSLRGRLLSSNRDGLLGDVGGA